MKKLGNFNDFYTHFLKGFDVHLKKAERIVHEDEHHKPDMPGLKHVEQNQKAAIEKATLERPSLKEVEKPKSAFEVRV